MSEQFKFDFGVSQGSYLGSVEFIEFSNPVSFIIDQHRKLGNRVGTFFPTL